MSPKDIANRIKAKGLTKLQFYCQMCGKACRDANGFKCHLTSESHKRQMEIFGQAPHKVIQNFTEEFESTFLEHLRRCHPFSRISANVVYNEYIQDRNHVHMNSTKWLTLTEFVKYLGKEGKCKVEDTPKGWFITLIQKDPFVELGEKKRAKKERAEREDEERHQRALEKQIERARKAAEDAVAALGGGNGDDETTTMHEVQPEDVQSAVPLAFTLAAGGAANNGAAAHTASAPKFQKIRTSNIAFGDEDDADDRKKNSRSAGALQPPPHKKSKVEQIMERDLQAKKQRSHTDTTTTTKATTAAVPLPSTKTTTTTTPQHKGSPATSPWLLKGIVVKVMSKALRESGYYKQKGVVVKVVDGYVGEIEMTGSGDVVRVDQAELETVVPQVGGSVLILAGPLRGSTGTLVNIDEKAYAAEVRVVVVDRRSNEEKTTKTVKLEYEDFSKLA